MAKEYYFQGKSLWSRLLKPDLEYRCWSQPLVLTPESYKLIMALKEDTDACTGILNEVKQTDDGYLMTFKRPMEKTYKGKVQAFTPPVILDTNGLPWQAGVGIGNGSDLTVKVEWYSFNPPFKKKRGSAIRLVSVRIDHLIPFEVKDFSDTDKKAIAGLAEQPQQLF